MLPKPLEISGRQNWANVGNLAQFLQNRRKNHQMLKNDDFDHFRKKKNLKIFDPQVKIFKKMLRAVEISAGSKILEMRNLGHRKSSGTPMNVF